MRCGRGLKIVLAIVASIFMSFGFLLFGLFLGTPLKYLQQRIWKMTVEGIATGTMALLFIWLAIKCEEENREEEDHHGGGEGHEQD